MRRISSLIVPNAVVALVIVSGIVVCAGLGPVRAEDCLAAPNVASPPGQHWYYRIDRATRHKCWYLHAPLRTVHQARSASVSAHAEIEHPAPAAPMPAAAAPVSAVAGPVPAVAAPIPFATAPMSFAAAPMPAADPPVAAPAPAMDDTPSPPHVTALTVKTIAVRPPGARTETQSRHGAGGAVISEASARVYSATPERKSEPTTFFFLVFGLGLITFLMAIVVKRVAPRARWLLWPVRTEAGTAWQEERDYAGAGPMRFTSRTWPARN